MKMEFEIVFPKVFQCLMWFGLVLITTSIVVHGKF